MFGYINVNREKLKPEDAGMYQSYYCGLCQVLKDEFGRKGQILLNYDMTFLIVLLTGLYELEDKETEFICPLHPARKRLARCNEATSYAAAMNVLLSAKNFEDDWKDNHSVAKKALLQIFKKDYERISIKYPRQALAIEGYLRRLAQAEKMNEPNVDAVAGLTGEMLGEIFAWKKEDIWAEELRCLGFYMGKFIYLMDAYEDIEKDRKNKCYNVLKLMQKETEQDFETFSSLMLTSMISECAKSFERLPILLHAEICRNILYSGVWTRYEYLRMKKKAKEEKKSRSIAKMDAEKAEKAEKAARAKNEKDKKKEKIQKRSKVKKNQKEKKNETVNNEAVDHKLVNNETAETETAEYEAADNQAVNMEAARTEAAEYEAVNNEAVITVETAGHEAAKTGTAGYELVNNDAAKTETAEYEAADNSAAKTKTAGHKE